MQEEREESREGDLSFEREKLALERERLALERERAADERRELEERRASLAPRGAHELTLGFRALLVGAALIMSSIFIPKMETALAGVLRGLKERKAHASVSVLHRGAKLA